MFNLLFIREQEKRPVVYCLSCACKKTTNLQGFVCLKEYRLKELTHIYNHFKLSETPNDRIAEVADSTRSRSKFTEIHSNIYSVKPIKSKDLVECSCKREYECGDNCLNRVLYTECNTETCPCGDKCRNTQIQKNIVQPVERFKTPDKGWGIKSTNAIKKGTYILEYVGEVVPESVYKERIATSYKDDIHYYSMKLDGHLVVDSHRMGNKCRLVNHSCIQMSSY